MTRDVLFISTLFFVSFFIACETDHQSPALLRSQCGAQILRLKGIVELRGQPEHPLVVQGVRQILHAPRYLAGWPDERRGVRLVIIGTGLDEAYVKGLFAAFMGEAAIDRPDRAALEDNPLAIAGFRP